MLLTKLLPRKSPLGEEKRWEQFPACAKRTVTKFDMAKAVLPMKWSSPGCTMVTLKSKILLYMSTPEGRARGIIYVVLFLNNVDFLKVSSL